MFKYVNNEELRNALQFIDCFDTITIQCDSKNEVGYIRHNIRHILGTPSAMIGNKIYYGRKKIIQVLPVDTTEDKDMINPFYVEVNLQ